MTFSLSYMTQYYYPELCVAVYRPDYLVCFHLVRRGRKRETRNGVVYPHSLKKYTVVRGHM